jgi:single-strand DNA-binding protein
MATIIVAGSIGKDCESRFLPDGTPVVSFNIADRGAGKDKSVWYKCSWFGTAPEKLKPYLLKGVTVEVVGKHTTDSNGEPRIWKDKDGNAHAENAVKVIELTLLGGNKREQAEPDSVPDDLPF